MRSLAAVFLAASLAAACASSGEVAPFTPTAPRTAWIVGANGGAIGQATITEAPSGVLIRLEFSEHAMPPGWHGAHVHQTAQCADVAAGFQASGAHVGHSERIQHGLLNPAGPEPGDLPNIFASPAGPFAAEFFSPWLTLSSVAPEGRMSLLDADGSAIIIHAGTDDHRTQPIGGAGARVGCASFSVMP